ncbi:MAG: putative quinol monooxygenase [Candidatus Limnocylindrales bacterium]
MTYVVVARWVAREGEEEAVERLLLVNAAASRTEPGCGMFEVQRSLTEPRTYLLYEQYDDEAAFDAHRESAHFQKYVLGDAVNRLDDRSATFYELLG